MPTKHKQKFGFTLVETLIGVSIFGLIILALTLFSRNVVFYNSFIGNSLTDATAARLALKTMSAEIRTASTSDTGTYVINTATASTFTFYSDIDDDGLKERVRYFLQGTDFKKGVTKPSGSPLTYNLANEQVSILVTKVSNTTIFQYYDTNYDGTSAALASPINIPLVRLVKISMSVDQNPNQAPITTTFSTQVSIRNLKDNL